MSDGPVIFPTPPRRLYPIEEAKRWRARERAKARAEQKRLGSPPQKKAAPGQRKKPRRKSKAEWRQCAAEDCRGRESCEGKAWARDPELRYFENRDVWVCINGYDRAYRRMRKRRGITPTRRRKQGR